MFKRLVVLSALFTSFQVHACTINYDTSVDLVTKTLRKNGWSVRDYTAICEKLSRANAALLIVGGATVLNGRSIAFATIGLRDKDVPVFTEDYENTNVQVDMNASVDIAENMLMDAMNGALEGFGIDKAIQSLNENRRKAKAAYSHG